MRVILAHGKQNVPLRNACLTVLRASLSLLSELEKKKRERERGREREKKRERELWRLLCQNCRLTSSLSSSNIWSELHLLTVITVMLDYASEIVRAPNPNTDESAHQTRKPANTFFS